MHMNIFQTKQWKGSNLQLILTDLFKNQNYNNCLGPRTLCRKNIFFLLNSYMQFNWQPNQFFFFCILSKYAKAHRPLKIKPILLEDSTFHINSEVIKFSSSFFLFFFIFFIFSQRWPEDQTCTSSYRGF